MPRSGPFWRADLLLVVIGFCAALVVPRWIDGQAALEWTRYHAQVASVAQGRGARRAAEQTGHAAARAIERAAPLPLARQAARLALDVGRGLEPTDPQAASAIYGEVEAALRRVSGSPIRGWGLDKLWAEAREQAEALTGKRTEPIP